MKALVQGSATFLTYISPIGNHFGIHTKVLCGFIYFFNKILYSLFYDTGRILHGWKDLSASQIRGQEVTVV